MQLETATKTWPHFSVFIPTRSSRSCIRHARRSLRSTLKRSSRVQPHRRSGRRSLKASQADTISSTVGAIDGKQIRITSPAHSVSYFFNYIGYHSLVLLAVVDSDYKFICASVGPNGVSSDAQVFTYSNLNSTLVNNELDVPPPPPRFSARTRQAYHLLSSG